MTKRGTHKMTAEDYRYIYTLAAELEAINTRLRYLVGSDRPAEIETVFVDVLVDTSTAWRDDLRKRARARTTGG